MGRYIVKIADHYLEWSTVVDAPVTPGMSLKEFMAYYQKEYGRSSMPSLVDRIARADKTGTSSLIGPSLEHLIATNHAGDDSERLTLEKIIAAYITEPNDEGKLDPVKMHEAGMLSYDKGEK